MGRCRAGLRSQLQQSHPSPRSAVRSEVRSVGTGQNVFGERARTSVPAPGAEGNQSDQPVSQLLQAQPAKHLPLLPPPTARPWSGSLGYGSTGSLALGMSSILGTGVPSLLSRLSFSSACPLGTSPAPSEGEEGMRSHVQPS